MSTYYSKKRKIKRQQAKQQEKKKNRVVYTEEELAMIKAEKEEKAILAELEKRKKIKKEKRKKIFDNIIKVLPATFCVLLILSTILNVTIVMVKQCAFKDYDDYSRYQLEYEHQIFKDSKNPYYVYFYQETCSSCNTIKKDVFQYIEKYNADDNDGTPTLYLFKISAKNSIVGDTSNLTGVDNIEDLVISGTPTLLLISDGKVKSAYENTTNIGKQLK